MTHKVENLKANWQYEFRIQYKAGIHESARSDWSPILQAATASEPMTGETVFKAIAIPGTDQLENLLRILYALLSLSRHRKSFIFLLEDQRIDCWKSLTRMAIFP